MFISSKDNLIPNLDFQFHVGLQSVSADNSHLTLTLSSTRQERPAMASEIPQILISAPLYDSDDAENRPSIIVTRDSTEEDFTSPPPPPVPEQHLYSADDSEDAADCDNVEDFIQSRLEMLGLARPTGRVEHCSVHRFRWRILVLLTPALSCHKDTAQVGDNLLA